MQGLPVEAEKKTAWEASKVIFINDVAFCAKDAIRLASHRADIACGLDFAHYEVSLSLTRWPYPVILATAPSFAVHEDLRKTETACPSGKSD